MPGVIRFAKMLCHLAQQEGIPLWPRQYHGQAVEIRHFHKETLVPLQTEVLLKLASLAADAVQVETSYAATWFEVHSLDRSNV